jgi:hypothetical protein
MSHPTAYHDPNTCGCCKIVPAHQYRRYWKEERKVSYWHSIAEGPDLPERLPREAHFLTILGYQLDPSGHPGRYRGALYFEFDATDLAQALHDAHRCMQVLHVEYSCPLEALQVSHSGGRGFHGTIPPAVLGAELGHPQLPRIYAAMIQHLFPAQIAPTLDRSIYNLGKGRMWRLPNRRRSDTGRYKVPLAMREVLHRTSAELEALTRRPRHGLFWLPEDELSPCPALVQLYRDTVAAVEHLRPPVMIPREDLRHLTDRGADLDLMLRRCTFLRHCRDDAATLSEPEWYAMVSNVARCRDGQAVVHELSRSYPYYSPDETDAKIIHALHDTGPHTCAFIQGLGFRGCPVGGCGVKAPIGLRQSARPKGLIHGWNRDTRRQRAVVLGG